MTFIFAADPGGTTGWACWHSEHDPPVEFGQATPMEFGVIAHDRIAAAAIDGCHIEVVAESFTIREDTLRKSFQPDALELIGVLRYLAHWLSGTRLILQTPAEAKGLIDNKRLRALDWWAVGQDHARDALRHLAYRMVRRGLLHLPVGYNPRP